MPQLIKPNDVKVVTKDGEVKISISLDLNINLNKDNTNIEIDNINLVKEDKIKEEKPMWQIPDFSSNEKINFGK